MRIEWWRQGVGRIIVDVNPSVLIFILTIVVCIFT